ncbi:hypothetical protein OGAPHI_001700 [Ogataea philodendri]|uniref:Major facilitator superfamily (MFS) profile domain-containing protein n=1 Tax=Ogataea philodendri TaxID=1378263 RepID=A0A9P8PA37_9ASCO|nr:uncharacterized protein OGAPHI_001700 [Ogataea philodendri]KAH3667946.1 hypothetical protein OGAPHI_001700 [Ogataea philodendri]
MDNLCMSAGFTMVESLEEKLHEDYATVSWVISGYSLTLGSFIILLGKFGDVLGLHKIYLAGLLLMSISTLICAVVPNAIALIVFRAIQGIAAAALIPTGMGLTASYFQGKQLLIAIRILLVVLTSTAGVGTVIGGAFSLTSIGYKAFFYFTFGVCTVCFITLWFIIIPVEPHSDMSLKNLDYYGAFFLVVGLLLVILGLTEAGTGWNSPKAYVPIPIGVVIVVAVAAYELLYIGPYKKKHPGSTNWKSQLLVMFPTELGKVRLFVISSFGSLFYYCAYAVMQLGLIEYHQAYDHDSALISGLRVFPIVVGIIFGSIVWRPSIPQKLGDKHLIMFSSAVCLGMSIWTSKFGPGGYWKYELVSLFLMGWAINAYYQIVYTTIITQVPLHLQATGSGIFQTFGQVGICLGSAASASIIGTNPPDLKKNVDKCFYLVFACFGMVFFTFIVNYILTWNKDGDEKTPEISDEEKDSEFKKDPDYKEEQADETGFS